MIPVMSRKENTLPLSVVSTLAIAVLFGHLLLPNEIPPPTSPSPVEDVAEAAETVPPFEVPASEAGRAFERQQGSVHRADVSGPLGDRVALGIAMAEEELQLLWDQGALRLARRAKAFFPATTAPFSIFAVIVPLGLAAFVADLRDAMAEEDRKQRRKVAAKKTVEPSRVSCRLAVTRMKVLAAVSAVACLAAAGVLLSHAIGVAAAMETPIAPSDKAELHELLLQAQNVSGLDDRLPAAGLAIWLLLGIYAAVADVREMALEMEETQSEPPGAAAALDLRCTLKRILWCIVAVVGVAAACGLYLLAAVWGAGTTTVVKPVESLSEAELHHLFFQAHHVHGDVLLLVALAVVLLGGLQAAFADVREMALEMEETESKPASTSTTIDVRCALRRALWCIAAVVGIAVASGLRLLAMVCVAGATADAKPITSLSEAELHELFQAHYLHGLDDVLLQVALAAVLLFGLWVALVDVHDMALEMEEPPSDKAKQLQPLDPVAAVG